MVFFVPFNMFSLDHLSVWRDQDYPHAVVMIVHQPGLQRNSLKGNKQDGGTIKQLPAPPIGWDQPKE